MTRTEPEGLFEDSQPGSVPPDYSPPKTAPNAGLLGGSREVALRIQDTGKFVNINGSGWAVVGNTAETKFILVQYTGGSNYIVVASGSYKGYYLSYNNYYYVGAYSKWDQARYWAIDPVDCSPYPGLYPYGDWVCCNGVQDDSDKIVTVVGF